MSAEATPTNAALPASVSNGTHSRFGYAVGLGLMAWLLSDLSTRAFATSMPGTLRELGLPEGSEALPGAIAGLTTTFAAIPMGMLADRLPARLLLITGLSLAALAGALALIGSAGMFGLVALFISIAGVLLPPVVVRLMRLLAPDLRGAAIAVVLSVSVGGSATYLVLTQQLGQITGLAWRMVYVLPLVATMFLMSLLVYTFRVPSNLTDSEAAATLPTRSMLHLTGAAIVLAALAGGASQLAAKLLSELQDSNQALRYYANADLIPLTMTVIGAVGAAFLYGARARWLPRLMIVAAGICLAALVFTALSMGSAWAWYSLILVLGCGAFAFAAALSACACWAREHLRGLLTGVLFAFKQLLGAILGAVLVALSGPAWALILVAVILCGWCVWHARRCEQVLLAPVVVAPEPAPADVPPELTEPGPADTKT